MRHFFFPYVLLFALSLPIPVHAAQPPSTVVVICDYGEKLMTEKKSKEAIVVLEQVFKRQPDYETARHDLAAAYDQFAHECKEQDEIIASLHRALALAPEDSNFIQHLDKALQDAHVDVASADSRVIYGDSLKAKGDEVGAYVEYHLASKAKDDPAIKKKIDEIITSVDKGNSTKSGVDGATLVWKKIELDPGKNPGFKFDYNSYALAAQRKVRAHWRAPGSLGRRKVLVAFYTNHDGTISDLKITKSSGDKPSDAAALAAVKQATPFKPFSNETFFDVPVIIPLDAFGSPAAIYGMNGEPMLDATNVSNDVRIVPVHLSKAIDAHLQAKTDAALRQAESIEQEIKHEEQQFGAESAKLCPKLCSVAVLYRNACEYQLSEDRLNRAMKLAQDAKADNEQAKALTELGELSYALGKNADAETRLKQAVELYESAPNQDKADYRAALEAYAKVLYRLNRVGEADQIYKKIKALPK